MNNGRRLLCSTARIHSLLLRARELAELRAEVSELREVLLLLVGISREQAEMDVATLRRQLMAILVRLERRDPSQPLH